MLYVLNAIELDTCLQCWESSHGVTRQFLHAEGTYDVSKKFSDHDVMPVCHMLAVIERFCADFIERVVYTCFKQEPQCH